MSDISDNCTVAELLSSARGAIRRFAPEEAREAQEQGALLIDIRPVEQRIRDGLLPGARLVDRNVLEWRLEPDGAHRDPSLAEHDGPVILICDQGYQSSLAAAVLRKLGVPAGDVIGGVQAWKVAGLTLEPIADQDDRRDQDSALRSSDPGYPRS